MFRGKTAVLLPCLAKLLPRTTVHYRVLLFTTACYRSLRLLPFSNVCYRLLPYTCEPSYRSRLYCCSGMSVPRDEGCVLIEAKFLHHNASPAAFFRFALCYRGLRQSRFIAASAATSIRSIWLGRGFIAPLNQSFDSPNR